jgi:probable HAF family extracellular repeat protein
MTATLFIGLSVTAVRPSPGANLPAAPGYVLTDLGSLGGGHTIPVAVNVRGDVAGYSMTSTGQTHAFLLPAGGSMQDLGTLGGAASYATGLNNRGGVSGFTATAAGLTHAFAVLDGEITDLGAPSDAATKALGINDLRQVLIVTDTGGGNTSSALWQNGQTTPLGTMGGSSTLAGGLNNLGEVVGIATAADGTHHAFVADPSTYRLTDLGNIGPNGTMAHVNEVGQAVGIRVTAYGADVAFGADFTAMNPLGDEPIRRGFSGTDAYGIDNENTVVGAGELSSPTDTNAGAWTPDGQFTNLNQALQANSGWALLSATAINDAGLIVGKALGPGAESVAYSLVAQGRELAAANALSAANSLDPAITAVLRGAEAAAAAALPSVLSTALTDLEEARSLMTPSAGESSLDGIRSSQASHLLQSAGNLLSRCPSDSPFLARQDRDAAIGIIAAARTALQ